MKLNASNTNTRQPRNVPSRNVVPKPAANARPTRRTTPRRSSIAAAVDTATVATTAVPHTKNTSATMPSLPEATTRQLRSLVPNLSSLDHAKAGTPDYLPSHTSEYERLSNREFDGRTTEQLLAALPPCRIVSINSAVGSCTQRIITAFNENAPQVQMLTLDLSGPESKEEKENMMREAVKKHRPDLNIAPFLKAMIPDDITKATPSLVLHPGAIGEKGPHSTDMAVVQQERYAGVTILQANDEKDGGPVYATSLEPFDDHTNKSQLYRNHSVPQFTRALGIALTRYFAGFKPVKGPPTPMRKFGKTARTLAFADLTAAELAVHIKASDSRPGVNMTDFMVNDTPVKMAVFNALVEEEGTAADLLAQGTPGQVLGQRDGAVLVACKQGAIWIGHAFVRSSKCEPVCSDTKDIKLSAADLLARMGMDLPELPLLRSKAEPLPFGEQPKTWQQVYTWKVNGRRHVTWNYYNGAMNSDNCMELEGVLREVALDDDQVVVLHGGEDAFSNGINLNTCEAARELGEGATWVPFMEDVDTAHMSPDVVESHRNIRAINAACIAVQFGLQDKLVVAAPWTNAGAGGAMMVLCADYVVAQSDVVFNPSYCNMGLFGSELHSFNLPRKVGDHAASFLTQVGEPLGTSLALKMNFVDEVSSCPKPDWKHEMDRKMELWQRSGKVAEMLAAKQMARAAEPTLQQQAMAAMDVELAHMADDFEAVCYKTARANFVKKAGTSGDKQYQRYTPAPTPGTAAVNVVPALELIELSQQQQQGVRA